MSTKKSATTTNNKRKRAQPEVEAPSNSNNNQDIKVKQEEELEGLFAKRRKELSEQFGTELVDKLMNHAKENQVKDLKDLPKALENVSSMLKGMNNSTADKLAPLFQKLSDSLGKNMMETHVEIKDGQVFFTPPLSNISISGFQQINAGIVKRIEGKIQLERLCALLDM